MTIYLKQSTASQEIPLGVFVDSTDGNTAETGLTIANTDIQLWKSGATTLANKNSGGATHISGGIYYAVLDATDTNTLGPLVIFVHVAGALAVRLECVVLAANVYDSMIAGSDALQVHASEISNNLITAAAIATDAIDADALAADAVAEINATVDTAISDAALATAASIAALNDPTAAAIADAVWDEVITGAEHNVSTSAAKYLREGSLAVALTGTAQAGAATTITLAADASATDDIYNFERVEIIEGTGAGQSRLITDYVGSTKVATVARAWTTNPDSSSIYAIMGAESDVVAISDNVTAADNVEANIGNLDAAISSLNNISTADVNAQVLDVLNVDTFAELTGVPADDTTLTNMVRWLYILARNKITQTADTATLYADDGSTSVSTSAVSDDGTTATRAEWS